MQGFAVIATHHKTGTVWMQKTLRQIGAKLGIRFVWVRTDEIVPPEELVPPIIFFERGGKFRDYPALSGDPRLKIIHLIRDPRDVIISGMHYHCISREDWLHRPSDRLGGGTYQSEINALPTARARYLFEMDNRAAATIRTMLRWYDEGYGNALECRYEDFIQDVAMVQFTRAATHLGFSGRELDVCRKAFWKNSLFGRKTGEGQSEEHIRSGKARQWTEVFDRGLAEEFVTRFPDALVRLGYESDDSWIGRLPEILLGLDK